MRRAFLSSRTRFLRCGASSILTGTPRVKLSQNRLPRTATQWLVMISQCTPPPCPVGTPRFPTYETRGGHGSKALLTHSITSSARSRSDCGMVSPSAFAEAGEGRPTVIIHRRKHRRRPTFMPTHFVETRLAGLVHSADERPRVDVSSRRGRYQVCTPTPVPAAKLAKPPLCLSRRSR